MVSIIASLFTLAFAAMPDDTGVTYPDPIYELTTEFSAMQMCSDRALDTVTADPPGEIGHYNATRVDFTIKPYAVDQVHYLLMEGDWSWAGTTLPCNPHHPHDLVLFKGPAGAPPPTTPVEEARITMSGSSSSWPYTATHDLHLFTATVPPGLVVNPGEDLWIAVQIQGSSTQGLTCQVTCPKEESGPVHSTYWSNASVSPFAWQRLEAWGYYEDGLYWLDGRF